MVYEIKEKSLLQRISGSGKEIGFKTVGAYVLTAVLLVTITVTFIQSNQRQTFTQEAAKPTVPNSKKPTPTQILTPTMQPTNTPTVQPTNIPSPTITPASKLGDFNNDGLVNVFDFSYLLSRWDTNDGIADITKDGIVNVFDFSLLLSNWDN